MNHIMDSDVFYAGATGYDDPYWDDHYKSVLNKNTEGYKDIAKEHNTILDPFALVWDEVYKKELPGVNLYGPDGVHLNAYGAYLIASDRRFQEPFMYVLVAESVQEIGPHQGLHRRGGRQGKRSTGDLTDGQATCDRSEIGAAHGLRVTKTEQAEISQFLEPPAREFMRLVDGSGGRLDSLLADAPKGVTNQLLFL